MSSIEGVEDPFGPETAGGTALLEREEAQLSEPGDHERFSHYVRKEKSWNPPLPVNPFARCAVRCGLLDAIRRNSQSAQPAKKSTRVLSLVKIIRITATNNGSFAPEYAEVCACIPSMGVQAHTLFWTQTDFALGKIIKRTLADVSRHGGRIYNLCFCRSLCTQEILKQR